MIRSGKKKKKESSILTTNWNLLFPSIPLKYRRIDRFIVIDDYTNDKGKEWKKKKKKSEEKKTTALTKIVPDKMTDYILNLEYDK